MAGSNHHLCTCAGAPPAPHRLRAWLVLALPARMERWYSEWLSLLVDELKIRVMTLALLHTAIRIVPGLASRSHLTLAHPVLLLHQLSWCVAVINTPKVITRHDINHKAWSACRPVVARKTTPGPTPTHLAAASAAESALDGSLATQTPHPRRGARPAAALAPCCRSPPAAELGAATRPQRAQRAPVGAGQPAREPSMLPTNTQKKGRHV